MAHILDRWFLADGIPLDLCIAYVHDQWLVILSYVVAAFASYTACHLIARVRSAANAKIRVIWLAIAGTSMGCGVFAMHFIAILAVRIPVQVQYDTALTALSALFAIAASGLAFHYASHAERGLARLFAGAVILGSGIGLMHYTGMTALRMPAHIYYDPALFALSVLVAVAFSLVALYVLRASAGWWRLTRAQTRLAGALVMGLAVTLMHYTGMYATYFYPDIQGEATGVVFDGTLMAVAVGAATFLISSIAISGALLDRRAEVAEARRQQSESFLQTIIDNSADGIVTFDEDYVVHTCNPAAGRIFGRDPTAIIDQRLDKFIDGRTTLPRAGEVHRGEAQVALDGDDRDIEYTVNDMRFRGRRMFSCLIRDITERKRAEEDVRVSEERFRSLVANVPGIVYQRRIDPSGKVVFTYISDQVQEVLGLDPADVVKDSAILFDRVHAEDREATFRAMTHAAQQGLPSEGMLRITATSGEQKWLRLVARPRLANGQPLWDGLLLDVTASVEQAEENKVLEARLRQSQKLESLGTLAGGIAHEFNNMLVPISGLTELAMRQVPEDTRAYGNLKAVLVNSRRAAQLVEKILSFARQEDSGGTAIDPASVVEEAIELLGATSPATITIRADIDRDVGMIYAGEIQIHQVLMNLASNARHAMEGKVGELTISLTQVDFERGFEGRFGSLKPGTYVKLSVRDTGHGMDTATQERIFEPFFTTKDVGKGTGLGLAVIHGIVTGHRGAIEVTSAPGKGTTFDVYLPRVTDAAPALAVA